ncbi:type III-B CRISPR-associated protein Cas10/Cmr2 [Fischerella thermalis CCMEE 5273]|nr:type III-B CRISPR-associated protein Cas10/Cmr2 [Fischerella thermalis CCMEE 5273]
MRAKKGKLVVSEEYWRAKIWGLLHDPVLKALHNNSGRGKNSFWPKLEVMKPWVEKSWNPEESSGKALKHIKLADYIASASDRGAIGSVSASINYGQGNNSEQGLEIFHLLSGAKRNFKIKQHSQMLAANRKNYLEFKEQKLLEAIPAEVRTDLKGVFWWLWRCLPAATCQEFDDESLILMPAETRLPDSSIWSHASITAALAGALAGYDLTMAEIEHWPANKTLSHPYLASFTFTPVQELIKASRKMRDFWAGSWLLHYLSAKVCWEVSKKYGPDSFLYPSLYQQPLIDHWLLQEFSKFKFDQWIKQPDTNQLLTAGFPNVLVLVLPKDKVKAAMQMAKQTLLEEWARISDLVFEELQMQRHWMPNLAADSKTWQGWLESQWQFYWTALPIGKEDKSLKNAAIPKERETEFLEWQNTQNQAYITNETVKRVLEKFLDKLLKIEEKDAIAASYPDLTAGVAGYLKVHEKDINHELRFKDACKAIIIKHPWAKGVIQEMKNKWGIPWIDKENLPQRFHPRLLNAGWLVEDAETPELEKLQDKLKAANEQNQEIIRREISELRKNYRQEIQKIIDSFYPGNNPADWYVLAAGDGDSMSEWLQGIKLKEYRYYIPSELSVPLESFQKFLEVKKRMGPSTHNALSRALLDFSNQLVPYLTQQRYAGRLIYAGGDDVLAYTNLWEWDNWLWDIRQCFRGDKDPQGEFDTGDDYWTAKASLSSQRLAKRPLFTMGRNATISFGVIIAHHSVPLAITLENLWDAEKKAKEHKAPDSTKKDAETPTTLRLGGEGHRAILQRCDELGEQWANLQQISQANFKSQGKSIAYLVTPGVFERKQKSPLHNSSFIIHNSLCRAYPWEWKLAHTVNQNQTPGDLVSMATEKPVPISCRFRDKNETNKSIPAPQVFAVPPGSLYYLNQPRSLFQDNEQTQVNKWRKLGYSELLWIRFSLNNLSN